MKLRNPEYVRMNAVIAEGFRKCLGKALLAVLVFLALKAFMIYLSASPFSVLTQDNFLNQDRISFLSALIPALVFFSFAGVLTGILNSGLISYITSLILRRDASFSDLLKGFARGRVWLFSLLHSAVSCTALLCASFLFVFCFRTLVLNASYPDAADAERMMITVSIITFFVLYAVFMLVFKLPFIFIWNILIDKPGASPGSSFVRSFRLLVPRFFQELGDGAVLGELEGSLVFQGKVGADADRRGLGIGGK